MPSKTSALRAALPHAFRHTLPILAGFLFLGMTYGIYMTGSGFPVYYPLLTSLLVFSGTMEFLAVNLLLGAFSPIQAFLLALCIGARHTVYGLSMLEEYRPLGPKKFYMVFGLCDETFSVNRAAVLPGTVDRGAFMFLVTLLDQCYWVCGASLGALFGSFLPFPTQGLDFSMTALFVVIFLEQLLKERSHLSSLLGLAVSLCFLLLLGPDLFLIPSIVTICLLLLLCDRHAQKAGKKEGAGHE